MLIKTPPISSFVLYLLSIASVPMGLSLDSPWFLLAIIPLIIVHHGTHEAVHSTLWPFEVCKKSGNYFLGTIGFALIGHNYIFLRWSHHAHHKYGRQKEEYAIERVAKLGYWEKFQYYSYLAGVSCIYHEIAGYLYPILGDNLHILSRRFKKNYYRNAYYFSIQAVVLVVSISLFYFFGTKYLICKLIFVLYWGCGQNVAHYGLEVGGEKSKYAARTYRLPTIVEFFMFRSGGYHLEHHLFPSVPGPLLNQHQLRNAARMKLGADFSPKIGLRHYLMDLLRQFRGPLAGGKSDNWLT